MSTTRAEISHDGDSTLATGTSRDDTETITALKAAGFRWSRNLESWFLPRTWREATRWQRVRQVIGALGEAAVDVDAERSRHMAPAAREEQVRDRAAERADRMTQRATRREAEAESLFAKSDAISSAIPFGQPILTGHHSQRRHERDLDRMHTYDTKGLNALQASRHATAAAARAERTAAGEESQITIGNRIERLEADQRRLTRKINGTGKAIYGEDAPATGEHRDYLEAELAQVTEQLDHERTKVTAHQHGPSTIAKGDFVKIRGDWFPVARVNKKTVTVPNPVIPTSTRTAPWREVTDHYPAETISPAHRQRILSEASPAFPELNSLVAQALAPDQPR